MKFVYTVEEELRNSFFEQGFEIGFKIGFELVQYELIRLMLEKMSAEELNEEFGIPLSKIESAINSKYFSIK